jgi:acyl carrier protein
VLDRSADVADRVALVVGRIMAKQAITKGLAPDEDLRAAGLSSLGLVNLMLSVEAEFGISIPERDMTPTNFRSIASISKLVGGAVRPSAAS